MGVGIYTPDQDIFFFLKIINDLDEKKKLSVWCDAPRIGRFPCLQDVLLTTTARDMAHAPLRQNVEEKGRGKELQTVWVDENE